MNKMTPEGIALIKKYESLHDGDLSVIGLQPKMDYVGIWTIGYGHALTDNYGEFLRGEAGRDEAYRRYGHISAEFAETLLKHDLDNFALRVYTMIKVPVTDAKFSALVSLAYNIGVNAFRKSTVLRKLNEGDMQGAADAFLMWNKAGGVVLKGLEKRRKAERELFLA